MAKKTVPAKKVVDSTGRTPITGIRIPADIKSALEQAALEDDRSVSGLVLKILKDWLREHGFLK